MRAARKAPKTRSDGLTRRGAIYYLRVYIPADLQPRFDGRKEIWRSLETADYEEAKRRRLDLLSEWDFTFDRMRNQRQLTEADMVDAVWQHYAAGLAADDSERQSRPSKGDIEEAFDKALAGLQAAGERDRSVIATINAMTDVEIMAGKVDWQARRRERRITALRADLAAGQARLVEPAADAYLRSHGIVVAKSSPTYREFCQRLARAELEHLTRSTERDRGDFSGRPADPIIVEPPPHRSQPADVVEKIMDLYDKYERENPNNIRPETLKQYRRDVESFASFIGADAPVSELSKRNVREWKDLLAEFPVKAAETTMFQGLTPRQVVQANKRLKHPKPAISRTTIRRMLASLSGFGRWLARNDYIAANPVIDLLPKKAPPANKRSALNDQQLRHLFSSPLFVKCSGTQWKDCCVPGEVKVRDHRYWIPWIMLYSGARPGEIAQLLTRDVRVEHGIWIMHITVEGDHGKRTKTEGSMRVVPIHSRLIELGFTEYCEAQAKRGSKQVFPEIEIPEVGQIAAGFSRGFNRYLSKIGLKTGADIVLYSLRHTFIDAARRGGILDDQIGLIVGHDKASMTGRYGLEQQGTLEFRQKVIEAVAYDIDRAPDAR